VPRSQDLPELIRTHLTSVWCLELLLLLRREPDRGWTVRALTQELRATDHLVATALAGLERSGLAAQDSTGAFRFAPASHLLAEFGDTVARHYQERPVAIINLIVAPEDRIQQLADAFRFRSDRR
jgi:hypothetical protein